jgi:Fur family transcriptional regulator, ferric uptake regulator
VTTASDLHVTVESRLRAGGQRYTPKRRALVGLLERARKPLSIDEIRAGRTRLPQSSIYRNLAALEHAGVVRRIVTDEEFGRYELTEDLTEHHHHLICSRCGKVQDVTVPADVESTVDATIDRLARKSGFAEVSHRLDLIGTCSDCARRAPGGS